MREIEEKMIEYLDGLLEKNAFAQQAISTKNPRALLIEAAKVCEGIREKGGNNKGPLVELIQKTIGGANEEAWCMAFVQTLIAYAEIKTGVASPIVASEHCLTVWAQTPKKQRVVRIPSPGAIIIWQHGKSSSGHTGIVLEYKGNEFIAIEGNTTGGLSSKDKVIRDGGGVYRTKRSRKGDGNLRIVGFLKPF